MSDVIPIKRKDLKLKRIIADGSVIPDIQKPSNNELSKKRKEELTNKLWPVSKTSTLE